MKPIVAEERVVLLDVLRGFAIFGMFAVNLTRDTPWSSAWWAADAPIPDRMVIILTDLLLNGRFITIFSVLFGIGFFIQLQRARAKGVAFASIYLRRIVGLFLIASVCYVAGLRTGILIDYAIFAFILLFFRNTSPRTLLFLVVLFFFVAKTPSLMEMYLSPPTDDPVAELFEQTEQRLYLEGSLPEIAKVRVVKLWRYLASYKQHLSDCDILAMLLLGFYLGRQGIVHDAEARVRIARSALPWLVAIGTAGVLGFVYIEHFLSPVWDELPLSSIKWLVGWNLGMILIGLAYAAAITLLFQRAEWNRRLASLGPVGRLALSNYIFTNLVYAVLSYGWGFGLYGQMRPATGLLIVVLLMPVQVMASRWWIKRYRFGPFEWCWRTVTYGKLAPMHLG